MRSHVRWAYVGADRGLPAFTAMTSGSAASAAGVLPLATVGDSLRGVDAVYVAASAADPAAEVQAALRAGIPVLCEAPVAVDPVTANAIRDLSILNGVPVMAAMPFLFHPQHDYALDLLRSGLVGELREVRVQASAALVRDAADADHDADGWLPASFVISAVRSIAGATPTRVVGWAECDDLGRDTGFAGTLMHADRLTASVSWSVRPGYGAGYTIVGTLGTIEVPHAFVSRCDELHAETVVVVNLADGSRCGQEFPAVEAGAEMLEQFAAALVSGRTPISGVDDIVATADAFEHVRVATGRPQTIPQRGQQWNLSPSA